MTKLYSYFESRLGEGFKKVVMFGLQYIIKTILSVRVTHEEVTDAKAFSWNTWVVSMKKGGATSLMMYMVVISHFEIRAIPEGTVIERKSNCLFSIESLDENVAWLPNTSKL